MNLFSSDFIDSLRDLGNAPGGPESILRAFQTNSWGLGGGVTGNQNTHTSWDDLLGGWGADNAGARRVGRGVGLAFAGYGAGAALGAGEAGATEVGAGLPLAEEAGANMGTGLLEPVLEPVAEQAAASAIVDQASTAPAEKGLISQAMNWVNAKPVNTMITAKAVEGVATGLSASRAAEKKRKADQEMQNDRLTAAQRQKTSNTSVGGRGVNLNMAPGNRVLLRPDGTPVWAPGGIINRGMNRG
jgi:hypothetical protein